MGGAVVTWVGVVLNICGHNYRTVKIICLHLQTLKMVHVLSHILCHIVTVLMPNDYALVVFLNRFYIDLLVFTLSLNH